MNPVIIKYPFDKTGKSTDNFVSQEEHEIPAETKRAFVPKYGPFFSGSVKITTTGGVELVPNVDFKCIRIYPDATVAVGQEVTTAIWITNQSVIGTVLVDYQVVGGPFSSSIDAIQASINDLQIDNRNVEWENGVIGKPATYPPSPHLHTLSQVFGFEYVVDVLERIVQALLAGDAASHEILYARLRDISTEFQLDLSAMNALIGELTEYINNHVLDRSNPHQTTKAQVGLGNVFNADIGTLSDIKNKVKKYVTGDVLMALLEERRRQDCPVGMIAMYPFVVPPDGWLSLQGNRFSAVAYPELAALFPSGVLPNMSGRFAKMYTQALPPLTTQEAASSGGADHYHATGYISNNNNGWFNKGSNLGISNPPPNVSARVGNWNGSGGGNGDGNWQPTNANLITGMNINTGASGNVINHPANMSLNFIIRAY